MKTRTLPSDTKLDQFDVTQDHLRLLRRMNASWWDCEWGAPGIDPKRPYGNGDVVRDIGTILDWPFVETEDGLAIPPGMRVKALTIHREMETVLQILVAVDHLCVGSYVADQYRRNWRQV